MLFVGTHERQLDDKGRLALPAAFRTHLGEHCYLAKGTDKCVEVIPAEQFEADAAAAMDAVRRGEASRQLAAGRSPASASMVAFDKQGRIKVDDALREYAEIPLDSTVRITGNFDRIEIWEPVRHRAIEAVGDDELASPDRPGVRVTDSPNPTKEARGSTIDRSHRTATTVRPSAAFRPTRWTAPTPPASVSSYRGDIPATPVGRGAADRRTTPSATRDRGSDERHP